jgi:hypothetical protein
MGLFKQLMIFGKTGLQGLPTRVALSLWAFSQQGVTGSPYSQHGILWQVRGEPQYLETFRAGADPDSILSHLGLGPPRDRDLGRLDLGGWTWAMDSGTGITGGGSGYAAILAHAGGVLYGTELGSVTLQRVGLFCFPIEHSTHTVGLFCFPIIHSTHTLCLG